MDAFLRQPVGIDELRLTLRADFPHDSWWKALSSRFRTAAEETLELKKESHPQAFDIKARTVEWLTLRHLKKRMILLRSRRSRSLRHGEQKLQNNK